MDSSSSVSFMRTSAPFTLIDLGKVIVQGRQARLPDRCDQGA